jgi:DNA-binding transcriptional regulator YiaG
MSCEVSYELNYKPNKRKLKRYNFTPGKEVRKLDGQEAKRRRLAIRKTQKEVADEIDVSVKTLKNWEKSQAPTLLKYYFENIGA